MKTSFGSSTPLERCRLAGEKGMRLPDLGSVSRNRVASSDFKNLTLIKSGEEGFMLIEEGVTWIFLQNALTQSRAFFSRESTRSEISFAQARSSVSLMGDLSGFE